LKRGFALVRDERGAAVRSAIGIRPGMRLEIELADGRIAAETCEGDPLPKAAPRTVQPRPGDRQVRSPRPAKTQPSLFDE
jgi:exodeoxyribonuclease VII large subunit